MTDLSHSGMLSTLNNPTANRPLRTVYRDGFFRNVKFRGPKSQIYVKRPWSFWYFLGVSGYFEVISGSNHGKQRISSPF